MRRIYLQSLMLAGFASQAWADPPATLKTLADVNEAEVWGSIVAEPMDQGASPTGLGFTAIAAPSTPQAGYFVLSKANRDAVYALINASQHAAAFALAQKTASFARTEKRTLCESSVITHVGIMGHGNESLGDWDAFKTLTAKAAKTRFGAKVRAHHAKSFGGTGVACDQTLTFMVDAARTAAQTKQYLLTFGYSP